MRILASAIGYTLLASVGSVSAAAPDAAQYPTKPIRVIAAFPPGGGVDIVARAVSERLSARLGQSLVVDNRPGAGTTIGTEIAVKSPPDGYTLLIGPIGAALIAQIYYRKEFDMRRDLAGISKIGYGAVVLVVSPGLGVASVKELIALAKAKPGQLTFASSGTGSNIHLTGEMFKQRAGIDIVHVPYKGSALMLPDLIEGRVSMALDSMPAHLPHIKTGRLRALAVASLKRTPQLPDVPTMIEAGMPGFQSNTDYALFAPARTPKEIVARLNRETVVVLDMPDLKARLATIGIEVTGSTPEAMRAEVMAEFDKWAKVLKEGNIKQE
jgi:tripartite-type tricarboxylate transporter receptor subunit TctC